MSFLFLCTLKKYTNALVSKLVIFFLFSLYYLFIYLFPEKVTDAEITKMEPTSTISSQFD